MQRSNIRTKSLVLRYLIVNCCDSRLLFPACARLPNRQLTAFYSSRLPLTHVHTASGIIHTASYSILFDEAVFASFRSRTFGASVCVCVCYCQWFNLPIAEHIENMLYICYFYHNHNNIQYNTILMCVYVLYLLHFFVPSLRQIHSKKNHTKNAGC